MILFYLDPGSGSFLVQLVIAGLAGLAFAIGAFWNKIKRFVQRRNHKEDDEE